MGGQVPLCGSGHGVGRSLATQFFRAFGRGHGRRRAGSRVRASQGEWCLLILCIATVLTAEMFNTAIEHLARAITPDRHDELRDALDTSSGAVLLASLGAATVGTWIFAARLLDILNQ